MFFGALLCATGIIYLLSLLFFPVVGSRIRMFTLLVVLLVMAGQVAFIALSLEMGIIRFGEQMEYSYPNDYLVHGPLGWVVMFLPIISAFTPLALAILFRIVFRARTLE